jgi:hypothetical protein
VNRRGRKHEGLLANQHARDGTAAATNRQHEAAIRTILLPLHPLGTAGGANRLRDGLLRAALLDPALID